MELEQFETFVRHALPTHYEVCPQCAGSGTQDCWGTGGMTWNEFDEQGPEFAEDYMSGVYSVPCEECNGLRVVRVVDREVCSEQLLAQWDQWQEDAAEQAAIEAAERRMGC